MHLRCEAKLFRWHVAGDILNINYLDQCAGSLQTTGTPSSLLSLRRVFAGNADSKVCAISRDGSTILFASDVTNDVNLRY